MREKYGMVLDVYALDAGNLDGAIDGYEKIDSEKIKCFKYYGIKSCFVVDEKA